MTESSTSGLTRRALLGAFAATAVVAAPTYSKAAGFLRGGGDIRRIRMYSGRTGERIDMVYWVDGKYIKDAVKEVNHFMRDWRSDQVKDMDLRDLRDQFSRMVIRMNKCDYFRFGFFSSANKCISDTRADRLVRRSR